MPRSIRPVISACLAGLALAGCSTGFMTPELRSHGNLPRAELVARVEPGRQSTADVLDLLGTPSSRSTFGPETWYYISRIDQPMLFLTPETLDQQVLAILFDEAGRVSKVERYSKVDAREVSLVERETETRGSELTLVQQVLGNLGRFEEGDGP